VWTADLSGQATAVSAGYRRAAAGARGFAQRCFLYLQRYPKLEQRQGRIRLWNPPLKWGCLAATPSGPDHYRGPCFSQIDSKAGDGRLPAIASHPTLPCRPSGDHVQQPAAQLASFRLRTLLDYLQCVARRYVIMLPGRAGLAIFLSCNLRPRRHEARRHTSTISPVEKDEIRFKYCCMAFPVWEPTLYKI
jgi:hypothetical protein